LECLEDNNTVRISRFSFALRKDTPWRKNQIHIFHLFLKLAKMHSPTYVHM
jgi:hypothetical protein